MNPASLQPSDIEKICKEFVPINYSIRVDHTYSRDCVSIVISAGVNGQSYTITNNIYFYLLEYYKGITLFHYLKCIIEGLVKRLDQIMLDSCWCDQTPHTDTCPMYGSL